MIRFLSRIVVGLLFLFSGFVKAVDPVGGAIKLKDYFEAFGFDFLSGSALFLAIFLSSIEVIIGFHLLVKIRIRQMAYAALVLMLFFTLLTFVLAIFNPVSDCGCFGDAIKLTNWNTFLKNLITLPFVLIIFKNRERYEDELSRWRVFSLSVISVIFAVSVSVYSYRNLPMIDFRPFKTGTNIPEAMKIPEGAQPEYKTVFLLEKNGVKKEFDENNYPYTDTTWQFIDSKTKLIKEGYHPPITDFYITNKQGEEATDNILNSDKPLFLMIAPDISKIRSDHASDLIKLSSRCRVKGLRFYCVTSSLYDEIMEFEQKNRPMFNYLFADEVLLQTIIRGNPGLVIIDKGTILAKYNYVNTPSIEIVDNPLSYILKKKSRQTEKYALFITALLTIVLVLIFYKKD